MFSSIHFSLVFRTSSHDHRVNRCRVVCNRCCLLCAGPIIICLKSLFSHPFAEKMKIPSKGKKKLKDEKNRLFHPIFFPPFLAIGGLIKLIFREDIIINARQRGEGYRVKKYFHKSRHFDIERFHFIIAVLFDSFHCVFPLQDRDVRVWKGCNVQVGVWILIGNN